jgi:GTP-binding protein EngB required for normal cell division
MATVQLDPKVIDQLSHDHRGILDAIDRLRALGVGKLVSLPQIIVVGDQSSGKSSVLEAISGVHFPSKGSLCTRFATELVLRHNHVDEMVVTIRGQGDGESRHISEEKRFDKEHLPTLVKEAQKVMGVDDKSTSFSEEVLRIEISGPKFLPLTLVDLPGFYHSGTSEQSSEGIEIVARLVEKYMKQKNSIILAIVSAKNLINQQQVLEQVHKHDPARERTMGIITKPDTLDVGSNEEEKYVQLASNRETAHILKLGWHVLRNRNSEENGERNSAKGRISDEERDDIEAKFLRSGAWASHPSSNKGIDSLRRKLSGILSTHIYTNLPSLVHNIESGLESRREALRGLGESRKEPVEMLEYLDDIFNKFRNITVAALKGNYEGKFFADKDLSNITEGAINDDPRKLRAVIRNLNRAFVVVISTKGSKFQITDYPKVQADLQGYNIPGSLSRWVDQFQVTEPLAISWSDMKSRLDLLVSNNQGTRFPGSPNDELALKLFREQSERWRSIATTYIQLVTDATKDFVDLALRNVVPSQGNTREGVLVERIEPFFELRSNELDAKLGELLKHYEEGDAVCLDDIFLADFTRRQRSLGPDQPSSPAAMSLSTSIPKVTPKGIWYDDTHNTSASKIEGKTPDPGLEAIIDMMNTYYSVRYLNLFQIGPY